MTHFGFALDFSDIDLRNIDLLDTHLDLLDTDITSKIFFASETSWRCLQGMSSRRLQDMCSRRFEDVFRVTTFRLPRRLENVLPEVLKTSSRRLPDVLEDVKLLRWRYVEDVFRTFLEEVFKTSWRPTNVCWAPW